MAIFTQNPAFSRGEIAPELQHRADLAWHRLALRTLRNRFVAETGGAPRRPGTVFVDECRFPNKKSVGLPFIFSAPTGDTYILEFGDFYMEAIRGGVRITEAAKAVTAAGQANPCALTIPAHGLVAGDDLHLFGFLGMTELNGRRVRVLSVPDANTVWIADLYGVGIDASAYGAYTGGGQVARVFKIPTPYPEADVERLAYAQSFDVMTLVHPKHAPRELARLGHTAWTLTEITFAPATKAPGELNPNTSTTVTKGAASTNVYKYQATAIDESSGQESLPGFSQQSAISGISQAVPAVVTTAAAHSFQTGDQVRLKDIVGMTELNDRVFVVTRINGTSFSLDGVDSTGYGVWVSGGSAQTPYYRVDLAAAPTPAAPHKVTIPLVPNCRRYPVYRERNGRFGYIGTYELAQVPPLDLSGLPTPAVVTFEDVGVDPDVDDGPPIQRNPFQGPGNYPSVVAYHQQRRQFGGTDNAPQTIEASVIGDFSNFRVHEPIRDTDAITIHLASGELSPMRHILPLRREIVLSEVIGWAIEGDEAGTITPSQINPRPYTYDGAGFLRPIKTGNVVLFVDARGSIVRDLVYEFGSDGYIARNRSLPSRHLFDGYALLDWAYQKSPHSIVWCVRDDGAALSLTYIPEQELFAWARHDTDGAFERVASVPEGDGGEFFTTKTPSGKTPGRIDGVYWFVRRTVNGQVRRYVERMDRGVFDALELASHKYLDSSLSYDGWHKGGTGMVLSGGVAWTADEDLLLTASAPTFSPSDIDQDGQGNVYVEYVLKDPASGQIVRLRPTAYTSPTEISVRADRDVPVSVRNTGTWAKAVRRLSGLWHLEGKQVAVLGDGFVVASPYNPAYPVVTVAQGAVVLPGAPRATVHVGLPYVSDFETLDVEISEGQSLAGKPKRVANVGLHLHEAAGAIWAGRRPKNDDGKSLAGLTPFKDGKNPEDSEVPAPLRTGFIDIPILPDWDSTGRTFARVVDPLPGSIVGTVLSVAAR